MAELFWASVEARPLLGISVPWDLLKFQRPCNRVCVSSKRKSIGCLLSNKNSTWTPSDSSSPAASSSRTSFDIISTSECSDGSIVFRFGEVTEAEENAVQSEEVELNSDSADEAASGSSSSENSTSNAAVGMLHENQQEAKLGDGSVDEVGPERLLSDDTRSVVALGVLDNDQASEIGHRDSSHTLILERTAGSHSVAESTVDPPKIVSSDSIARGPSDHRVSVETRELHNTSEDTHLGSGIYVGPEAHAQTEKVPLNNIHKTSPSPVAEPELDYAVNLQNNGGVVGAEVYTSSTPPQNSSATFISKEASDLKESPQAKFPEADIFAASSESERAVSLEEESREETPDEDHDNADLEELPKAIAPHDDIKAVKKEEILPIKTEEEDTTSASSGSSVEVAASSDYHSQENHEENIELEHSGLSPVLVADEPMLDNLNENLTSEDTEEVTTSQDTKEVTTSQDTKEVASLHVPASSELDDGGQFSTSKESVDGEECSKIMEMSAISDDELESVKFNHK
ncbi:hypothetical protein CRG98_041777, partial [Punica granatum]